MLDGCSVQLVAQLGVDVFAHGVVITEHTYFDESMRLECGIGFFEDGRRQPVSADHHDGVQVVCVGPQGTTFGGGQFNCRHSSIIKP